MNHGSVPFFMPFPLSRLRVPRFLSAKAARERERERRRAPEQWQNHAAYPRERIHGFLEFVISSDLLFSWRDTMRT